MHIWTWIIQAPPFSPCTQNEIHFASPTLEQQQNTLTWVWTLPRLNTTTVILCTTVLSKGNRIYATYTACMLHHHSYIWSMEPFSTLSYTKICHMVQKQCLLYFLSNYNYNYKKIHILYKFEIIFPQSFLHYQHTLSTFALDAVRQLHKTFCWSVRALHTQCASACPLQNSVLGVSPSGGQKYSSQSVLNQECRENEGE